MRRRRRLRARRRTAGAGLADLVEAFREAVASQEDEQRRFRGFDFSDLFEGARAGGRKTSSGSARGFKDIFSSIFTGGRGEPAQEGPEPGSDLEYQVNCRSGRRSAAG